MVCYFSVMKYTVYIVVTIHIISVTIECKCMHALFFLHFHATQPPPPSICHHHFGLKTLKYNVYFFFKNLNYKTYFQFTYYPVIVKIGQTNTQSSVRNQCFNRTKNRTEKSIKLRPLIYNPHAEKR